MVELLGRRVVLRAWRPDDRVAFRRMGADPRVMEFMPAPLAPDQADALADRLAAGVDARGWGLWALEIPGVAPFAGFVGLNQPAVALPFGPCVEIAWRLDSAVWGRGYATEAAQAVLDYAFEVLALPEVVSFTAVVNARSQAVMRRLEMVADGQFDHPLLPEGHWLRRHVLYRKTAP
ncbi:MAG TPA: GNAT family N-acetyltransferase [Magnetospirillum sp.]|nr:GNAT family N-acetyltransferase [Magnetospirillum sp.]